MVRGRGVCISYIYTYMYTCIYTGASCHGTWERRMCIIGYWRPLGILTRTARATWSVCLFVCVYVHAYKYVCMYIIGYWRPLGILTRVARAIWSVCSFVCVCAYLYVCLHVCISWAVGCFHKGSVCCLCVCMHTSMSACMYIM
jgi:hypothetical protein